MEFKSALKRLIASNSSLCEKIAKEETCQCNNCDLCAYHSIEFLLKAWDELDSEWRSRALIRAHPVSQLINSNPMY